VVVATTTVGTTTSDFFDRTLGLGYIKASIILSVGVVIVLGIWRTVTGKTEFENIVRRSDEFFYWLTILIANTLGTALGDYVATDLGLGFGGCAAAFSGLLIIIVAAHFFTRIPKSVLFWSAYVLTRPLGVTLGDTLTKPRNEGGLSLGRVSSSVVIFAFMVGFVVFAERRSRMEAFRDVLSTRGLAVGSIPGLAAALVRPAIREADHV